MADYYPLIAKAVSALDKSTPETRRALYDRARNALLEQLRGVPSEAEMTRERMALEDAIRKVEAESRRAPVPLARPEFRPEPAPPQGEEAEEAPQIVPLPAAATARAERFAAAGSAPSLADNGLRSFRRTFGDSTAVPEEGTVRTFPGTARDAAARPEPSWPDDGPGDDDGEAELPPRVTSRDATPRPPVPLMDDEEDEEDDDELEVRGHGRPQFPRVARPTDAADRERLVAPHPAARSSNRSVAIVVIGLMALGIAGVSYVFSDDIAAMVHGGSAPVITTPAAPTETTRGVKSTDRAPSGLPALQEAATPSSQKVVLYEEDPANPSGTQVVGNAVWHTERVTGATNQPPETVIRGEIEIPDQKLSLRLSVRRNDDKQLPASHTVEVMFKLPPDFTHGSIDSIPGIMVKQGEASRGIALTGVAVRVTDNFFLVGLSSADTEMQRNIQLLKERNWFDIPIVYSDGKRALIAIEKGPAGERAFAEAFSVWEGTAQQQR